MKHSLWSALALTLATAAAVTAAPTDSAAPFPDVHSLVAGQSPAQVQQQAHEALRQWFASTLQLSNPKEAPLWQGAADWMADDAIEQAHPEWQGNLLDAGVQARVLWDDEDGHHTAPASLIGGHGSPAKAEALLRMIDGYLGRNAVRLGLQAFVASYDGRPVTNEDLWSAIQAKAGTAGSRLHLGQVMQVWMDAPGLPLIQTHVVNGRTPTLAVAQSGFSLYPGTPPDNSEAQWVVPLWVRYEDGSGVHELRTVLEQKSHDVPLPAEGRVKWAYPNAGGMGFYRTELPPAEMREIMSAGLPQLSANEKVALMSNTWRMVRHGSGNVADFLDLVEQTKADADPDIAQLDLEELGFERTQVHPEDRPAFDRMVVDVLTPCADKWGLEPKSGEPPWAAETRPDLVQSLARAGDADAQQVLQGWADRWLKGDASVLDYMVAASDDTRVFDKMAARLKPMPSRTVAMDTLQVLSQMRGVANTNRYVSLVLSNDVSLSDADKATALLYPLRSENSDGMDAVWLLLKSRWDTVPAVDTVAAGYALSPYRSEVERLAASQGSDSAKEAINQIELKGPGSTLQWLPDQLHDYLKHRSTGEAPRRHKH